MNRDELIKEIVTTALFGDAPKVAATPVATNEVTAVVGSFKKFETKEGSTYESFNAYISDGAKFGILLSGLRIMQQKICAPAKFNPGTKKMFNTAYLSRGCAEAIHKALLDAGKDVNGNVVDAIRPVVYDMGILAKWLPESVEK